MVAEEGCLAYLQVKYAALPNYEERTEEFCAEAVLLRRKFTAAEGEEEEEEEEEHHHLSLSSSSAS